MVYISGGTVKENPPWSFQRLTRMFWGIIAFIVYFFQTLIGIESRSRSGQGGRGGGSGPSNGPGGGPKRIGRITTIEDCSMPGGG